MKDPLDLISPKSVTSGEIIKAFRKNFEVSQDDLAWVCGISQGNLSAIENGRREVGPAVAVRIAAYFGISPTTLLYPNGFENCPEYIEVQKRKMKVS